MQLNVSLVMSGKQCAYCGKPTAIVSSRVIYGTDYGLLWWCKPCGAYVGCHRGTSKALGRVAKSPLRTAKKAAHAAFDPLWKEGAFESRRAAYAWLASRLGISNDDCHIGMFDEQQCRLVIELCREAREPC